MSAGQTSGAGVPRRIQLSRKKGWRKPEGAVVVSRPSIWGNPFRADFYGAGKAVRLYRAAIMSASHERPFLSVQKIREELRGKDLACWCKLGAPCHADVLLELANGSTP